MAADDLRAKIEEVRRLAAASRKKLSEIAVGVGRIREEVREISNKLQAAASGSSGGEERAAGEREQRQEA